MKEYIQIYSMLLLFVFITSCKGQNKTDLPKDSKKQAEINLPDDYDPYFIETNTISSSYGPSSITRNIIQDRNGNIWFASWEGIIRYDGQTFTNFTNQEGLRPFHVFSVLEAKNGDLWFGTIGAGVYHYDGKSFANFTTMEGLAHNRIGCILEDKNGNIWFGSEGGASCFDGKFFRNFTTKEGLSNNDVNSIVEDKTGNLWFGTRGDGICFYDGNNFHSFKNKESLPFNQVRSIIEDKNGNLWFGGNDGLWRYNGSSFTNFTTDFVGYIYEDKTGNIWTSSEVSNNSQKWVLSRYDEKSLQDNEANATQILIKKDMFFGILEDKEGSIWLGTLNGACRYDGKTFNYFKNSGIKE